MLRRLFAITGVLAGITLSGTASAYADPSYYLALGDSIARGIQPDRNGVLVETNQGYVDDLYVFYRSRRPDLRLTKLGCSRETTGTMITGGVCAYPLGSQLAQAVQFLQTHRVALVTLTIGADNVLQCLSAAGFDPDCVAAGIGAAGIDLPYILATLRTAAGPHVPIVAMNYYDPFLGLWRLGPEGQAFAIDSLKLTQVLNTVLEQTFGAFQIPFADVAQAFRITDFRPIPLLDLPINVFLALSWTWIGIPPPRGPDVHPNAIGYAVIAGAFVKTIAAN